MIRSVTCPWQKACTVSHSFPSEPACFPGSKSRHTSVITFISAVLPWLTNGRRHTPPGLASFTKQKKKSHHFSVTVGWMDKPLYIYLSVYKEVSLKCLTFDTQKKIVKIKTVSKTFSQLRSWKAFSIYFKTFMELVTVHTLKINAIWYDPNLVSRYT